MSYDSDFAKPRLVSTGPVCVSDEYTGGLKCGVLGVCFVQREEFSARII